MEEETKWLRPGTRGKAQHAARDSCRAIVRKNHSMLSKVYKTHVHLAPCSKWPQGLTTAFHGWVDLLTRLVSCEENPDLVTDGIYVVRPESTVDAKSAKSIGLKRGRAFENQL